MIPIRDDTPRFHPPYVTYFLIAFNLIIYAFESTIDRDSLRLLIDQLGVVPVHIVRLFEGTGRLDAISALTPILTSMFLHGSWPHVIGNMWFLWIFGDNIEDYLGHFRYLIFYLVSGITAAAAQILLTPTSRIPTVGASGAIAGVLGAYFLLYPRARVLTWFGWNRLLGARRRIRGGSRAHQAVPAARGRLSLWRLVDGRADRARAWREAQSRE